MAINAPHQEAAQRRPYLLPLLALSIGLAGGLGLGRGPLFRADETGVPAKADAENTAVTFTGKGNEGRVDDVLGAVLDSKGPGLDHHRRLIHFVDSLAPGEVEGRIDEVLARRKGPEGYDLIAHLYSHWVAHDRSAALRHAQNLTGMDRHTALSAVLHAWARQEPRAMIAWVQENRPGADQRFGVYQALETLAREAPAEAIALAMDGNLAETAGMDPNRLYGFWAEKDPLAAAARALSIEKPADRREALGFIASQWALEAPEAAWNWASSLEHPADREEATRSLISYLALYGDTGLASGFLDKMPPGKSRIEALNSIVSSLANHDHEAAYRFVRSRSGEGNLEQAYSSVFYRWALIDPEGAFKTAHADLDPGRARRTAYQYTLTGVAKRDPEAAVRLFGTIEEADQSILASSLANALAEASRVTALTWAGSLPDGEVKESVFASVLSHWTEEDPKAAAAFGLQLGNPSLRQRSLSSTLSKWAESDARQAMTWAVEKLAPEDQSAVIPGQLLRSWVRHDLAGASAWVGTLPEGTLRDQSVPALVATWSDRDLVAAGEWLKQLPPGRARDLAAERYAGRVFNTDPEAALAWASSIGAEAMRKAQLGSLAERYLRHQPEKAKRWIAESPLPEEQKAALLQKAR